MLRKAFCLLPLLLVFAGWLVAESAPAQPTSLEQVIERITSREAENFKALQQFSPMVETYIQEFRQDKEVGQVPANDHYYLGRASFKGYVRDINFLDNSRPGVGGFTSKIIHHIPGPSHTEFIPVGFAQMAVIDNKSFDSVRYDLKFIRREFLGEVRCLVFDVSPKPKTGNGRFVGRIWVEDKDYNIVRVNGTYSGSSAKGRYLHFDTWRLNLQSGLWLPVYIYSEESDLRVGLTRNTAFKSQTRLWGYDIGRDTSQEAFTQILVESDTVKDQSESRQDMSPVAAGRAWERQAEENVLDRMQSVGLIAPPGAVEKVLQTVVDNLIITNNLTLEPEVRCRILVTSPLESFTVGHTIVVSRGLLDVLPDEASLAAVLAHELSHLVLGHGLDTKYAFSDRMIFPDDRTLQSIAVMRTVEEQQAADKKSLELLLNSPYKDKLASIGLFMRQLEQSRAALPKLIRSRMGNSLVIGASARLETVKAEAPQLEPEKLDQLAALPLGGRVKIDPWSGRIELSKARPVPILNPREKKPFEVTPVFPYLTRFQVGAETPGAHAPQSASNTSSGAH
ncbi:MAG: M48 family metalloprotease [Candidatus Korobacteraceae bacterium]|jgi:hypothetical protein